MMNEPEARKTAAQHAQTGLRELADVKLVYSISGDSAPTMVLDRGLRFVFANDSYLDMVGMEFSELAGRHVFDCFPERPTRVEMMRSVFRRVLRGETARTEAEAYEIPTSSGRPALRYWSTIQEPVRDEGGNVNFIIQRAEDVTENVLLAEQAERVVRGLDHRISNVLSVVETVTDLSFQTTATPEDFKADLAERIHAMSRNHARLYRNGFEGLAVKTLLGDELGGIAPGASYSLSGPKVVVGSFMARDLAMILHELAVDAAKRGVFSTSGAYLDVSWVDVGEDLSIEWRETGVGISAARRNATDFSAELMREIQTIDVDRSVSEDGVRATVNCAGFRSDLSLDRMLDAAGRRPDE